MQFYNKNRRIAQIQDIDKSFHHRTLHKGSHKVRNPHTLKLFPRGYTNILRVCRFHPNWYAIWGVFGMR